MTDIEGDINTMLGEEPLLPEFQPYVREHPGLGQVFHHPLYISAPYFEIENKRINTVIPWRQARIEQYKAARKWTSILALHERPYRFEVFKGLVPLLTDAEYWDEVSWLWTDCNNVHENQKGWRRLWVSKRPGRERVMSPTERRRLAQLPDIIPIYRGTCIVPQGCRGMSWTTNRAIAERFATKGTYMGAVPKTAIPHIVTATVLKRHVIAYFDHRDEDEIVTLPEKVRRPEVVRLP